LTTSDDPFLQIQLSSNNLMYINKL